MVKRWNMNHSRLRLCPPAPWPATLEEILQTQQESQQGATEEEEEDES